MNVRVRLFARARELVGVGELVLEAPAESTVGRVRRLIVDRHPRLAGLMSRCAIAVNEELAEDDRVLTTPAEIAVLPPVSGG